MAVKIRLQRQGRKKTPYYYVVIADSRSPRDGKFIERIGTYNPNTNPATIDLNGDKALAWMEKGAIPTDTVHRILSYKGVLFRKHLNRGVKKGAFTAEDAEKKFGQWLEEKAGKLDQQINRLKDELNKEERTRMERESKVAHARAQEILAKKLGAPVPSEAAEGEEEGGETPANEAVEAAPVAQAETPAAEETAAPAAEEKNNEEPAA